MFESPAFECHIDGMTDTPKRPRDANQLAKLVVDLATGPAADDPGKLSDSSSSEKDQAKPKARSGRVSVGVRQSVRESN